MLDKLAPVRQANILMPKLSPEIQIQEKLVPNGNRVLEVTDRQRSIERLNQVVEHNPIDRVTVQTRRG